MTRKLEELFDLPPTTEEVETAVPSIAENRSIIQNLDAAIDKIDAALPAVRGLESTDTEMDELAGLATGSYRDLMDLGMQVDSRYASEIFAVAGAMLGHALTAKTAKMNKKLKMIQLQLQKARLDLDREKRAGDNEEESVETAEGQVLSRNDLLDRLIGTRDQKNKPA